MVEDAAAKIVRGDENERVGCGAKQRQRIEVVEARLIADESKERAVLRKACGSGDVAVDAGEAPVGEKAARAAGEEEVVGVADRHAVAEKDGSLRREELGKGAVGGGFCRGRGGEMGGDEGFKFVVERFPRGEPVWIGGGFEKGAEFCSIGLDAGGKSAGGIEEMRIGTDVDAGAILADPVERFFRGEPLAEVEDQIGFERRASFEDPVVVADLLRSGGTSGIREDVGEDGPLESLGEREDRMDVGWARESADEEDAARRGRVGGEGLGGGFGGREMEREGLPAAPGCFLERERFAEWTVEMDGAGGILRGVEKSLGDCRAEIGFGEGRREVALPPDEGLEEFDLVGGLVGPAVAEFMRAVGSEENEGSLRVVRLHDGREEVGCRGAGGGDEGCGAARALGEAEGEKGKAALIEVDVGFRLRMIRSGQHERRGAGAGSDAEIEDALQDELVDDPRSFIHRKIPS